MSKPINHASDDTQEADVDDLMNVNKLDRNSIIYIFGYIQPSLLFTNVVKVCKGWSHVITDSNFIFGYFKNTYKLQSLSCDMSQIYSKQSLNQWTVPNLKMELKKRKLKVSGKKEGLIERLYNAMTEKRGKDCESINNTNNANSSCNTNTINMNTTNNTNNQNDNNNSKDTNSDNANNTETDESNQSTNDDSKCGLKKSDRSRILKMKLRQLMFNRRVCQNCLRSRKNDKSIGSVTHRARKNVKNQSYYHFRTICDQCSQLSEFNTISLKHCIVKYGVTGKDLNKFGINIIKNETVEEKTEWKYKLMTKSQCSKPQMLYQYINNKKRYDQNERGGYTEICDETQSKKMKKKKDKEKKKKKKQKQNKQKRKTKPKTKPRNNKPETQNKTASKTKCARKTKCREYGYGTDSSSCSGDGDENIPNNHGISTNYASDGSYDTTDTSHDGDSDGWVAMGYWNWSSYTRKKKDIKSNLRGKLKQKLNDVIKSDDNCFVNLAVVKQIAQWKYQTLAPKRRCSRLNDTSKNKDNDNCNSNRNDGVYNDGYNSSIDIDPEYYFKKNMIMEMAKKYGEFYDDDEDKVDEFVKNLDDDDIYDSYIQSFTTKKKKISFKYKSINMGCKKIAKLFERNEIFYNARNLKRDINTVYQLNIPYVPQPNPYSCYQRFAIYGYDW